MKRLACLLLVAVTVCGAAAADAANGTILQMRKVVEAPGEGSEKMAVLGSPVGEVLNVSPKVLFSRKDLKAVVVMDHHDYACIGITFTQKGREKFATYTRDNLGTRLAIIIDGQLYCAPTIRAEIAGGKAEISGNFTEEEAQDLVAKITEAIQKD